MSLQDLERKLKHALEKLQRFQARLDPWADPLNGGKVLWCGACGYPVKVSGYWLDKVKTECEFCAKELLVEQLGAKLKALRGGADE